MDCQEGLKELRGPAHWEWSSYASWRFRQDSTHTQLMRLMNVDGRSLWSVYAHADK
jgi:hypothetical protein